MAPVAMPSLRQVAIAGMAAYLGSGAILGGMFAWLTRARAGEPAQLGRES